MPLQHPPIMYRLVDNLLFDPQNPRFTDDADVEKTDPLSVIRFLYEDVDLQELLLSMTTNGYINIEPLVIQAAEEHEGKFYVLEGNRRLAALMLLRDETLAKRLEITVPQPSPDVARTFDEVSTYLVASRDDARAFIGFKHINGAYRWDALAKASFAADWIKDKQATIETVASMLGDNHKTVARQVFGLFTLRQAKAQGFKEEDRYGARKLAFSHLYVATSRPGFRKYLGLKESESSDILSDNPIPLQHKEQLDDVMLWLYGSRSRDIRPLVRSQNPDLNTLNDVLLSPMATKLIQNDRPLHEAARLTEAPGKLFSRSLLNSLESLGEALQNLGSYDRDKALLDSASQLSKNARVLYASMQSIVDEQSEN